jgi:two-component system cell cycle sensor histidine kinase/response regulator CckA
VNARDAMPKGGLLKIETSNCLVLPNDPAGTHTSGGFVKLSVVDTGSGIEPAVQPKIFEPFFTTKEVGKGTGLGLSTVYGIVKQSGGEIVLDSKSGLGTRFDIYFPALTETGECDETAAKPSTILALRKLGTALVCEDDPHVQAGICECLESFGMVVLKSASATEALNIAREKRPDLLVTDIIMPGMSGLALVNAIRDCHPHLKVLLMTGYAEEESVKQAVEDHSMALLQKPFTAEQLIHRLNEFLPAKQND